MVRKMLIANDGSAGGERALACALDLAKRLSVRLDMICVEELPQFPVSIDEVEEAQADQGGAFAKVVAAAEKAAAGLGVPFAAYVVPGDRSRASSNSSSAAATISWSSASWAIPRSTTGSSAAPPTAWSKSRLAKSWWSSKAPRPGRAGRETQAFDAPGGARLICVTSAARRRAKAGAGRNRGGPDGQNRFRKRAGNPRFARQSDSAGAARSRRRDAASARPFPPAPRPASTRRSSCATATRSATAARACARRWPTSSTRSGRR